MLTHSRIDSQPIIVELDKKYQYGIMLSGGLDSAVLLCLMLEDCKQQGISPLIKPFTIPKHDGASLYIKDIITYAENKFGVCMPATTLVGDPDVHHRQQSATAFAEIFSKYKFIDFVFSGINQNPPNDVEIGGTPPQRDTKSPYPKIIMPFVALFKTHIIDLVYQYNLEELINITHSCTEQKTGRCNQCFQCNERAWAFAQLEKVDTGTL